MIVHHHVHQQRSGLEKFGRGLARAAALGKTVYDVGKFAYGVGQAVAPYVLPLL